MKKSLVVVFLIVTTTLLKPDDKATGTSDVPGTAVPPVAKKFHTENHINGGTLVDDYKWLREKSNPEVAQYLQAENAYADAVMKPTEALQTKLYEEMVSHIKETDVDVPYKQDGYFYYARWEQGKQYQIFARKKASLDAAEEITVDVNQLAQGEKFMALAPTSRALTATCSLIPLTIPASGNIACSYATCAPAKTRRRSRKK